MTPATERALADRKVGGLRQSVLLRVGVISVVLALALAAGAAAAAVALRAEEPAPTAVRVDPLAAETATHENDFDSGKKLELDDKPSEKARERSPARKRKAKAPPVPADNSRVEEEPAEKAPQRSPRRKRKAVRPPVPAGNAGVGDATARTAPPRPPSQVRKVDVLPIPADDWPEPSTEEITAASAPRYYRPQQDARLFLTVGAIGLYDVPVMNSDTQEALNRGVIHLPQTPFPWDERGQKNVYLAGHRFGYGGTGSRMVFYNLDKLRKGDSVVLKDGSGNPYEYRVSEMFVVRPDAMWAIDPVRGRDMLTLQTCTYPDPRNRIIVRADRA